MTLIKCASNNYYNYLALRALLDDMDFLIK